MFTVLPTDTAAKLPALRWDTPADTRRWLDAVRQQAEDAFAAGEDTTRRPGGRVLSRAEARRKLEAAGAALANLLDAAERGLPDGRTE